MDETDIMRLDMQARQRAFAWVLGLCGLIPFVACAIVLLALGTANPLAEPAVSIFRNYAVVILSFLGGIRWGHAILPTSDDITPAETWILVGSVISSLVAWASMFLDNINALGLLLLAFCAQGAWDSLSANSGKLPKWFAPLRIVLTTCVVACHIAVFLALISPD